MFALIFAAGVGSRLKPWTDSHPKALVDVDGKPMLQHVIEKIVAAGITDIIINVHHFADQIKDFLRANDFGANIRISDESGLLLETGGGLRKVVDILGAEPVLVHNADIMTDFNLHEMIEFHESAHADVTLLTASRETSRYFVFDKKGRLRGWTNVSTGQVRPEGFNILPDYRLFAFDGVHIVNPEACSLLKKFKGPEKPFSIVDFYIKFCSQLKIRSFELPKGARWFDVGKPATLEAARKFFKECPNIVGKKREFSKIN